MDKTQMKNAAKSVFERYKDRDKVYITSDGQAFFDESHAKNHKVKNRTGKELLLEAFLRAEVAGGASSGPKNAKAIAAEVAGMATVEEVQEVLDAEVEGENRKTVVEACERKIAELKASQQ